MSPYLAEVWDLDGLFSSLPQLSTNLVSTAQYQAIKYDQQPSSGAANYHVPLARWADYVAPPSTGEQVHGLIRDFMFLHAASISNVGDVISGGTGTTAVAGGTGTTPVAGGTGTTAVAGGTGTTPVAGGTGTTPVAGGTGTTPVAGGTGTTPVAGGTGTTPVAGGTGTTATGVPGGTGTTGVAELTPNAEPPHPAAAQTTATVHACRCQHCLAIAGITGNVSNTAITALTAITAVSSIVTNRR